MPRVQESSRCGSQGFTTFTGKSEGSKRENRQKSHRFSRLPIHPQNVFSTTPPGGSCDSTCRSRRMIPIDSRDIKHGHQTSAPKRLKRDTRPQETRRSRDTRATRGDTQVCRMPTTENDRTRVGDSRVRRSVAASSRTVAVSQTTFG